MSTYTSTSISNYNASAPPDDGSQTSANKAKWSDIKTKLTDPLRDAIVSIDSNLTTNFTALDDDFLAQSIMTTRGDILTQGASAAQRLATGTAGQILRTDGTDPSWGSVVNTQSAQATTSGTAVTVTSIPSWVTKIHVLLNGVSFATTAAPMIQIGDSGGLESTGYTSSAASGAGSDNEATTGFVLVNSVGASSVIYGRVVLEHYGSNLWVASGTVYDTSPDLQTSAGSKTLSGTLDRISLTSEGGDTFDAGAFVVSWM